MEPLGGACPCKNNNGLMDEDEGKDEATTGQIVSAFTRSNYKLGSISAALSCSGTSSRRRGSSGEERGLVFSRLVIEPKDKCVGTLAWIYKVRYMKLPILNEKTENQE